MNKCKLFSRMWFLVLLLVSFVSGCATNANEVPAIPDTTRPTVSFTSPANGETAVPINRKISVAFSETMNSSTITTATFLLTGPGTTPVTGTVAYIGTTATFTPTGNLANSTLYTVTITTGAQDLAGNALAMNYTWNFTTGAVADTILPTVSFTAPVNGQTAVPTNRIINAAFSEPMDPATITATTFRLTGPGTTTVTGTVSYIGTTATFRPAGNLANSTLYTATITTGAQDLAGNAMAANYVWTFTTGAVADTIIPTVSFTAPVNGQTAVPINRILNVAFSEPMNPLTITTATFKLQGPGTTPVTGTVAYIGTTATFTPASNLANSTLYTATITTGALDLAGNALATNYVWTFTTSAAADTTRPTVSFTSPTNGAIAVPLNRKVNVAFSEAMDPVSITTATFRLTGPGATPVTGTVAYIGATATFTPAGSLASSTVYTGTITTAARDLAGNALVANYVWTFTTGVAADTTAPTVISTIPLDLVTGAATNSVVTGTFSESMDPLTISTATFSLKVTASGNNVPGAVIYTDGSKTATFTPLSNLANNTNYTATIKGGATGVKDLSGNALALDKIWTFTTGAAADTTRPTVILVNPADLATGVALNSAIHATFSEAMDPLTISTATFSVAGVTGLVTYDPLTRIATLIPASNLAVSTTYTAKVTTGVADLAGNGLAVDKVWSFTTAAAPIIVPSINLRTAAPFGTFGGTAGMTNTGTLSLINGDIGTTATGTTAVTGFHDTAGDIYTESPANIGPVNGLIYTCTNSTTGPTSAGPNAAACAIATQARLDAQTAYLALVAMPPVGASPAPGANLAGLTLLPGVYVAPGGSFMIQGGDLTLDAQGDANAIWVFQMATTLTVGGPGAAFPQSIILAGGAQAKNVFWQVGSFATINAAGGGTMVGTIISQAGASFSTVGNVQIVTLNGRALSLGASVTLVDTVINVPAP